MTISDIIAAQTAALEPEVFQTTIVENMTDARLQRPPKSLHASPVVPEQEGGNE